MAQDMVPITIRLPRRIYEALRHRSYESRQPMNMIVGGALALALDVDDDADAT